MFQKFTSKPVWHRLWAVTVAAAAVCFLVRYIIGPLETVDYTLATYALGSLVADRMISPR